MAKKFSFNRKNKMPKKMVNTIESEKEKNKLIRIVTFEIDGCVKCPYLNKVSLQSGGVLVSCMDLDDNTFHVSNPELLDNMFNERCKKWPGQGKVNGEDGIIG